MFRLWRRMRQWRMDKLRAIYRFWDGSRWRRVDPVATYLAIKTHPTFNGPIHCQLCDENDPEAIRITTGAVKDAFGVQDYDELQGVGLTVGEQLGLLGDFYVYLEEQKKSMPVSPTSSASTEESTCTDSASETTPPTSDCGSAETAPTFEEPTGSG